MYDRRKSKQGVKYSGGNFREERLCSSMTSIPSAKNY